MMPSVATRFLAGAVIMSAIQPALATEPETARGFTLLVTDCEPSPPTPGAGLGTELRFADHGVCGTALAHEGELIALTAFPQDVERSERERAVPTTRVRRPSRRRNS